LSALFFMLGVLLFSGSLYLLCFTRITTFAMVTPIGGLCLLCGWILLVWSVARRKSSEKRKAAMGSLINAKQYFKIIELA
jgi:uncharacterized membrane protein YgdD (TMEM256/DUF423 family)